MKYRIIQEGLRFYPQYRTWGLFWIYVQNGDDYDGGTCCTGRLSVQMAKMDCELDAEARRRLKDRPKHPVVEEFDL
jgi:hypothetical protein